jgi:hypothetical protein
MEYLPGDVWILFFTLYFSVEFALRARKRCTAAIHSQGNRCAVSSRKSPRYTTSITALSNAGNAIWCDRLRPHDLSGDVSVRREC